MNLIATLIIGAVAGWLAAKFMNKRQGFLMNLVVGVVGAYIGRFLGDQVDLAATSFVGSIVMATIGAVILLWVVGKLKT